MSNVCCIAKSDPDFIHVRYDVLSRKATALVIAQHDIEALVERMRCLVSGIEAGKSASDMTSALADAKAALALIEERKTGNQSRQRR
jgi:hypothetical protein